MAPTPFSESNFRENLLTSLIPIQHKTNTPSNSNYCRNLVNSSTRTDVQNILKNSILQAKKDFEDYAESQRNVFSNNFSNQLNRLDINANKSFDESMFTKPSNEYNIIRKGPFFQDPLFEECQRQFEKSVQDIVTKYDLKSQTITKSPSNLPNNGIKSSFMNDAFKSYRNLRDTQLQEENQAASLVHEDHQHKIVIDVKDFMSGDVKVNSFNNTIRVEGRQESSSQSPKNSSSSKRNFCKEFTLPGSVNMGSVKSTMSSDGILTITVARSQPEPTSRISFPKESNISQISQSPSQISQSPLQITHPTSQKEWHLTIQEVPSDGLVNSNGSTSQNYVTYPEEVDGVTSHAYSRKPHGGYWKR